MDRYSLDLLLKTVEFRLQIEPDPPQRRTPIVDFVKSLSEFGIIAEYKRASPKGVVRTDIDPLTYFSTLAPHVEAFSVLTEPFWFLGDYRFVTLAKVLKPVLFKDFVIHERQIDLAYGYGADAVLIIYDVVGRERAMELSEYAFKRGLTPIVEVGNAVAAKDVATWIGKGLLGINARNLRTLEVNFHKAIEIAKSLRGDVDFVIESGISSAEHAIRACEVDAKGVLIGTALMKRPELAVEIKRGVRTCVEKR